MQSIRHLYRPSALRSLPRYNAACTRNLSLLSLRRPQALPSAGAATTPTSTMTSTQALPAPGALDLMPRPSAHPSALGAAQVRHGPRDTTPKITHRTRKRRVGFLARKRSITGRRILKRRIAKGRIALTH